MNSEIPQNQFGEDERMVLKRAQELLKTEPVFASIVDTLLTTFEKSRTPERDIKEEYLHFIALKLYKLRLEPSQLESAIYNIYNEFMNQMSIYRKTAFDAFRKVYYGESDFTTPAKTTIKNSMFPSPIINSPKVENPIAAMIARRKAAQEQLDREQEALNDQLNTLIENIVSIVKSIPGLRADVTIQAMKDGSAYTIISVYPKELIYSKPICTFQIKTQNEVSSNDPLTVPIISEQFIIDKIAEALEKY